MIRGFETGGILVPVQTRIKPTVTGEGGEKCENAGGTREGSGGGGRRIDRGAEASQFFFPGTEGVGTSFSL